MWSLSPQVAGLLTALTVGGTVALAAWMVHLVVEAWSARKKSRVSD